MAGPDTDIGMSRMSQNDYETKEVEISKLNNDGDKTGKSKIQMGNKNFDDKMEDEMEKLFKDDEQTKDNKKPEKEINSKTLKVGGIGQTAKKEDTDNTAIQNEEYGQNIWKLMKQEHIKMVHDEIKNFVCDTCPNSFRKKSYLRQHQ